MYAALAGYVAICALTGINGTDGLLNYLFGWSEQGAHMFYFGIFLVICISGAIMESGTWKRLSAKYQASRSSARGAKAKCLSSVKETRTRFSWLRGKVNFLPRPEDASAMESANARLRELAFKDEVTGLYNRRFFSIRLEEEVSRYSPFKRPVSVVLADLDGFEAIKNELGLTAGDDTLRGMAEILLRHTRGINVIARYDGSLFAVVLIETSKAGARLYADRIRYVLSSYQFAHRRRVTATFGIASLPEDGPPTAEDLLRAADDALSEGKRA